MNDIDIYLLRYLEIAAAFRARIQVGGAVDKNKTRQLAVNLLSGKD